MTRLTALVPPAIVVALLLACPSQPAFAQPPAPSVRLLVTVVDPSGSVIPGATVTVTGIEEGTKAVVPAPIPTLDKGIATFERLAPGRYAMQAEFAGFDKGTLKDVRLRAGDNRHVIVLVLQKVQSEITVSRDRQMVAADPRAQFGTALTREQIEALSDDPAEMAQQLQDMAGPSAVIRVDSFEGGRLPPKSQIKSIHITRDAFAAENHFAGGLFIDIITQPGVGPIRGGGNLRLRDGSMSGRSPLTTTKGAEQTQSYGMNFGGSLLKQKSSFSLSINGQTAYDTPNSFVFVPGAGVRSEPLSIRHPTDNLFVSGLADYAITRDQTLRVSVQRNTVTNRNQGVGAYDEAERAFSTDNTSTFFRIQEAGPLGRRFFTNTRVQIARTVSDSRSGLEAPTYRVTDARTTGGAQVSGGRHTTAFNIQSDLDYVRGIQSVRTGISLDGGRYRSNDSQNYLGTYLFESPTAFQAGRPSNYLRRIGDPNISYANVQAGLYIQDDVRVRKNLTFSPGVRYEVQTHLRDYSSVGPRFGMTWAPFKNGKTSLRGSWGIFYDWLNTLTYEQSLRVDGFRQRELNIANPSFPDPGDVGSIIATNQYLLPRDLSMVRNMRVSAGIDQTISPRVRVSATYANTRGTGLLRGRNLNAPSNGVRPNPAFVNIVEVVGDAASRQHALNTNAFVSLAAPSPALAKPRVNWKRTSINVNYSTGKLENNTDGAFSLPASGSPASEWAEIPAEIRHHRGNLGINTSALRNLNVNLNVNASTGTPYTITTGRDDNGDLVYNDRPAGVGRNTLWTPRQVTANAFLSYMIPFGKRAAAPPGITGISIRDGVGAVMTGAGDTSRYRLGITAQIQNLTNHANYAGFSGTMTSPFFRQATNVLNTRKVDIGISFSF